MRKSVFFVCFFVAVIVAVSGCSMSSAQRLFIWSTGFNLESDVAYGPETRQKLDIYSPKGMTPRATVVFIYGGSWTSGEKALYRFLAQALTGRGYQVVIADYRLYPQVRYPAFVEDTARALAWTKTNIAAHGGTPDRIILMGHSAGAYNAVMVAIDPRWLAPYGLKPRDLTAVISLAGPLSFNPLTTESTKDIFAGLEDVDTARPVKLAAAGAAGAPPFLFLHGDADTTVYPENASNMTKAVNDAGGTATLKFYPGVSHLGVVTCFAWPLRWRASCLDDVDIFMTNALKAASAPVRETTQ